MKVRIVLLFLSVLSILNNLGTLALQSYSPTMSSLGKALTLVLSPSQCAKVLLDLDTEIIQVGWCLYLANNFLGVSLKNIW